LARSTLFRCLARFLASRRDGSSGSLLPPNLSRHDFASVENGFLVVDSGAPGASVHAFKWLEPVQFYS
jgi:hypothetical protein